MGAADDIRRIRAETRARVARASTPADARHEAEHGLWRAGAALTDHLDDGPAAHD